MPGKPWTEQEIAQLRELWQQTHDLNSVAKAMNKSVEAVRMKLMRLGLRVVEQSQKQRSTTHEISLPVELPSVEEALKILAGALKAAVKPDLDKVEIQRLHVVATLAKTYKELLADYIDYRTVEAKLLEMEEKYAELTEKAKGYASKPDTAQMVQPTAK